MIFSIFLFIAFILGLYTLLIEPRLIKVTRVGISSKKWPYKCPLKIVILSDFHILWPWMTLGRVLKIITRANTLKPDIVCLLGDFKGDSWFGLQICPTQAIKVLDKLKAKYGIFAVLGNHDLRSDNEWPDAFKKSKNIKLLRGEITEVNTEIGNIYIAGIDDFVFGKSDVASVLNNLKERKPIVFLTHNPDVFPLVSNDPVVTLSGHTHAGQIRFPIIGSLGSIIPSKYGKRYDYGHINEDGKDLFVTAGLGMTTLPIRFLCRPEIVEVVFNRG